MNLPRRITIAGVGLIGGSLGMALRALPHAPSVTGWGKTPRNLDLAVEMGAIDSYSLDLAEAVAECDLLVVCTPVRTIVPIVEQAAPHISSGAIVTDAGSTKTFVVSQAEGLMPEGTHFIGAHPMAGSEITGIAGASATLFRNAFYILTPTAATPSEPFSRLHSLVAAVGARVISIPPETHDEIMATISHMPHLISAALVNAAAHASEEDHGSGRHHMLSLTAGGFRDMTRIAASSPEVWIDICLTNPDAILKAMDEYSICLAQLRSALTSRDEEALRDLLEQAAGLRRNLPGAAQKEMGAIRVRLPIPDQAGVISTVTLAVGELGINVVDLELLHLKVGEEALLELSFADLDEARAAVGALAESGFDGHIVGGYE